MPFEFNAYSSLLLIGCVQALLFSVLLLHRSYRSGRPSDLLAALILMVGGLFVSQWMLGFAGWYDAHDWRTTLMFYVNWDNLAALGPLLYLYFCSLTNTDFHPRRRDALHFLPFALLLAPYLFAFGYDWIYHLGYRGLPFTYFHGTRGPAQEWLNSTTGTGNTIVSVLVWIQLSAYLLATLRDYRLYRAYLRREFSSPEPLELTGLRSILYLFVGGLTLMLLLDTTTHWFTGVTYTSAWWRYFCMSVLIHLLAIQFYALTPERTRALRFRAEGEGADAGAAEIPDPALALLVARLQDRMRETHDYLDPDLRLRDLAERLHTSPTLLSRAVNGPLRLNFNDYVNGLRCRHFLQKVEAGEHRAHTLLSLAIDCGFNSKSTFNRAFRKCEGISPKEAVARLESLSGRSQKAI